MHYLPLDTKPVTMRKILPIANILALIVTVAVNYLSVTGIFNGNTMAAESARYANLFTPASWAFSIWGLIYLALGGFVIYQARGIVRQSPAAGAHPVTTGVRRETQQLVTKISGWFLLSCLANCLWVITWLYDEVGLSVLIMLVLAFSLLKIIQRTDMELTDPPLRTIALVWWPFCLYSGWISVALLANISAWLVKIHWTGLTQTAWAILFILLAGALHLFMTWKRNMREFAMVGVWALVAIGLAHRQEAPAVTVTAWGMAAVLFVSSSIHGYINRATSPFRRRPPDAYSAPFRQQPGE
jgi:hypothetical protein